MVATVVSFWDCRISSCSSTGSPVKPTFKPGTSWRVSLHELAHAVHGGTIQIPAERLGGDQEDASAGEGDI